MLCTGFWALRAEPPALTPAEVTAVLYGPSTCSTSGCHGGAGDMSRQYVIWSQRDVHSRSFNTLTSARSARMAEALKLENPANSARCTACHAPLQTVSPTLLAPNARIEDGVGCVTCHGIATEDWIRTHTRPDFTHQDRVAAGMRDLRNLYHRANNCVACHQNIDPELVKVARHPQLLFELDGQTISQPKHWRESAGFSGAQAWYVGQVVALREMSWALSRNPANVELDAARWAGLVWLVQRCETGDTLPSLGALATEPGVPAFTAAIDSADQAARHAADIAWSADLTRGLLQKLAATQRDFLESGTSAAVHARRAERLVVAFDRLLAALPQRERPPAASAQLDRLYQFVQSLPDFKPIDFARELAAFEATLTPPPAVEPKS